MTRALSAILLLGILSAPALAQERPQRVEVPRLVHYGKWATLGAAVGTFLLAGKAHDDADRAFDRVVDRCRSPNNALCEVGPSGGYLDPTTESLYQESLRLDRSARRWLVAGEVALVGTAVMFIWEFTRPKGPEENIPFAPRVTGTRDGVGVGMELRFSSGAGGAR